MNYLSMRSVLSYLSVSRRKGRGHVACRASLDEYRVYTPVQTAFIYVDPFKSYARLNGAVALLARVPGDDCL